MSAAQIIEEQVPEVVRLARASDPSQDDMEFPQGEPVSDFLSPFPTGGIIVPPGLFDVPSGSSGTFTVRLDPDELWLTEAFGDIDASLLGKGAVIKAEMSDRTLWEDDSFARAFEGAERSGRWVYLEAPPLSSDLGEVLASAAAVHPSLGERVWYSQDQRRFELIGLAFAEEVRQGVVETGWAFLSLRDEGRGLVSGRLLRGMRFSEEHLGERLPFGTELRSKVAAIVGLGALGSPVAIHLARNLMGTLRLMDFDYVDPGGSVRWEGGLRGAGALKTYYLTREIESQYPLTSVEHEELHLGAASLEHPDNEFVKLGRWMRNADLVIDASAEDNINRLIAHLTHPRGIPQLYLWSIDGHGGVIALLERGRTGCYLCLESAISDGLIESPAAALSARRVQPRGCNDPTFVASHLDLLPLSVEAGRMGIARLTGTDLPAVLTFQIRAPAGDYVTPSWKAWDLEPRKGCALCEAPGA